MKTEKKQTKIFLVLVPHRDIRVMLRKSMSNWELSGAYSFPLAAPIASLLRPFSKEELKDCARAVREASLAAGGKISAKEAAAVSFPGCDGYSLFGPRLDLAVEPSASKISGLFLPPVIGCCLLPENCAPPASLGEFSFRAAAVANMFWRPLNSGEGYKWKIGQLCWLPSVKKRRND